MVFSSVPVYLDPPNWQQISQQSNHQPAGYSNENLHLPPLPPPPSAVEGDGIGSIRPRSMSDRARLAKVPQPEPALKCPRCESTNTKFCYFNNYSLTQPRHFCKTCRRYWTRGGALRNVPVGGGCRRNNKKSKGTSRSKSPVTAERQGGSSCNTRANNIPANSCSTDHILCNLPPPPQQYPFLPPLHHLSDFGAGDISLNFGGLQPPVAAMGGGSGGGNMEFHIGSSSSGGVGGGPILSSGLGDLWRMPQVHQFPFLAGLEPPSGLYQFEGEGIEPQGYGCGATGQLRAKPLDSVVTSQMSTVKMEENQARLHLSRNFLGDHYWGGNAWTDHLSGSITEKSAQR